MYTYIVEELPKLVRELFQTNEKQSIMGHSMGGCAALLIAARDGLRYKSFSAIAPRCSPSNPGAVWAK
jgi:S-formylglutathione hydrolase